MQSVVAVPAAAAHDLNEELTIILNAAAAALALTELGHPVRPMLKELQAAAMRTSWRACAMLSWARRRGAGPSVYGVESAIEGDDYGVRHNLT